MANEHPFQMLFETLGRVPIAHAEPVNRQAYEILYDILSVPLEKTGRCILLRAPRAGHGKTHLLSRIQHHLGSSHEFIPLHAAFGCQIDAASVIDDTMRCLLRPLPASGGLCVLDLVARRLFSTALQPLVASGEVPCQDREGALTALRTRPIETFDFNHPNAVTAHWARENFEILGQRLSVELAQRCGLHVREVAFWVDALFRFAATPLENPSRLRSLADVVHAGSPGDGVLMERLEALLGMLALLMRVVLVADDLEGFSADESAALRLAAFLGTLRQSVERLDVILSLNQDIWDSAFVPRLSGGLADRLSEVVVELGPLTEDEMVALLESRVPGFGTRVLASVDRSSAGTHARGLIRAAGVAWLKASAMDSRPVAAATIPASAVPVPAVVPAEAAAAVAIPDSVPSLVAETASLETVAATPPSLPEPVASVPAPPVVVNTPAQPEPANTLPTVHTAVDPTLAISFLAASASTTTVSDGWPTPDFAPPVVAGEAAAPAVIAADTMFQPASEAHAPSVPAFEPVAEAPAVVEQTPQPSVSDTAPTVMLGSVPEPVSFQPVQPAPEPVSTPMFQPAPEPVSAPLFQPAPESMAGFQPAPASFPSQVFQPVSEPVSAPVFQPAPETSQAQVFQPAPVPVSEPAFQPAPQPFFPPPVQQAAPEPAATPQFQPVAPPATPAPPPAPDTDRVDELLRQFRERYGRGAM